MTTPVLSENLRGMLLMTLAMAAFATADAAIKLLAATHSQAQIIWITGLAGALIFAVLAIVQGQRPVTRDLLAPSVLARVAAEGIGTIGIVTALSLAPLSTVVAIMQSVPLLVTVAAALFLGEVVGIRRWIAIFVGLGGVLLILRPGGDGYSPEILFAVLGAVMLAARDLFTRLVPPTASNLQLGCWGFAGLVPTGLLLGVVSDTVPGGISASAVLLFGAVTALTVLAIWAITAAMRAGDVSVIAPFRYTRLLFGLTIAILFFGERPDFSTWAGAAIIAASGLYTFYREARLRRKS
ncbi:MAG: DMT family transporter [Pseudomonadota bacterium]